MDFLTAFLILYLLTGVTFVAYDFKLFQRIIFYVRVLFTPGITALNPKLYEMRMRLSFYLQVKAPFYVGERNYGHALLYIIFWPLIPYSVLLPWLYLKRSPEIKFVFNFYVIPIILLTIFYLVAIQGFVEFGKIWQDSLVLAGFIVVVWLLCHRKDKKIEEWRERRSIENSRK